MIDQGLSGDLSGIGEMVAEEESTFDDPITISRFTSQPSSPGAFGTPQKPQFTAFQATATLVEFGVAAKMFEAGVLVAGDIVLQIRDKLNEGNENIGGSQLADRIIFRGIEYRMVQRPEPVTFGGGLSGDTSFYIVHLRRTNSTSDTVGG